MTQHNVNMARLINAVIREVAHDVRRTSSKVRAVRSDDRAAKVWESRRQVNRVRGWAR